MSERSRLKIIHERGSETFITVPLPTDSNSKLPPSRLTRSAFLGNQPRSASGTQFSLPFATYTLAGIGNLDFNTIQSAANGDCRSGLEACRWTFVRHS
jgi:hypothetical protein